MSRSFDIRQKFDNYEPTQKAPMTEYEAFYKTVTRVGGLAIIGLVLLVGGVIGCNVHSNAQDEQKMRSCVESGKEWVVVIDDDGFEQGYECRES